MGDLCQLGYNEAKISPGRPCYSCLILKIGSARDVCRNLADAGPLMQQTMFHRDGVGVWPKL